jgi:hypothetical protein
MKTISHEHLLLKTIAMHIKKFIKWVFSYLQPIGIKVDNKTTRVGNTRYKELLKKVDKLEKLMHEESLKTEKLKSSFLNNIYHEIRTPMNSIVGFAELLKQKELSNVKQKDYLNKLTSSSEIFLQLLDNLLEASLIESGNVEIKKDVCNLHSLIDEVQNYITLQKHMMEKDSIVILRSEDKYYPNFNIITDKEKLFQILSNLLVNALKFTEKGVVEFGYKVLNLNKIMFYVKDSGIGTNDDKNHQQLFDKFIKSEYCFGKENKGFGLGLCIAKGLVNLFNGDIWVESNNYGGSTFKFTIPFSLAPSSNDESDNDSESKGNSRKTKMLYL